MKRWATSIASALRSTNGACGIPKRATGGRARSPAVSRSPTSRPTRCATPWPLLIALEGFHRQCNVLTLANLAQIVNVLQSVVMTDGPHIWLTPTYHALRLHAPHIGATALQVRTEERRQPARRLACRECDSIAARRQGRRHRRQPPLSPGCQCIVGSPVPAVRRPGSCLRRPVPMPATAWPRLTPWRRLRWRWQRMGTRAGGWNCRRTRWRQSKSVLDRRERGLAQNLSPVRGTGSEPATVAFAVMPP